MKAPILRPPLPPGRAHWQRAMCARWQELKGVTPAQAERRLLALALGRSDAGHLAAVANAELRELRQEQARRKSSSLQVYELNVSSPDACASRGLASTSPVSVIRMAVMPVGF